MKRIASIGHAQEKIEILDDEAWRLERIALQLRTTEGLPIEYLSPDINLDSIKHLVKKTESHLQLINDGPLLVDAIAAELV
ncbi:MAG: hypothetical protein ACKVKH_18120 [Verrucomicrobiales bacterium]|jgi:coproporphyrinogen III oxidase-like Fe-S oxidoreductase